MEHASKIIRWLRTLPGDPRVGVDDGGLCLRVEGQPEPYYEIGGIGPEDIEAEDDEEAQDAL